MTFHFNDLIKANKTQGIFDQVQLLPTFNLDSNIHALIHFQTNRIISLCKYKQTVHVLSDTEKIQPLLHLDQLANSNIINDFDIKKLKDVLRDNTLAPYYIKLKSNNSMVRNASEYRLTIYGAEKTTHDDTFSEQESLLPSTLVGLRIKSAALDNVYDWINLYRSRLNSDLLLQDYLNEKRYQQAISYLSDDYKNIGLLTLYASQLGTSIEIAAKHCKFCYEEDQQLLEYSEQRRIEIEESIRTAICLEEIQDLLREWFSRCQIML
jgi:hypothetical protein